MYNLIKVKHLQIELGYATVEQMKLYYDNQATICIAFNPILYERTKKLIAT